MLPLHTDDEAKKCLEDSGFVLKERESVWGYPMGQWSDENGKLKEITAQRVDEKFQPSEVIDEILKVQEKVADGASQEERKNAKPFFQDPTRNPDTGANQGAVVLDEQGSARAKALGFDAGVAQYLDVRDKNTEDKEPWFPGMDAKQVCDMPTHPTATPRNFPGMRCGFVGKLDEAYPALIKLPAAVGFKSSKVKFEAKVALEEAKKKEWNAGGKITASLTPPGETGDSAPVLREASSTARLLPPPRSGSGLFLTRRQSISPVKTRRDGSKPGRTAAGTSATSSTRSTTLTLRRG